MGYDKFMGEETDDENLDCFNDINAGLYVSDGSH
jgi:hypothetical protein